jgi:hypothetical protein
MHLQNIQLGYSMVNGVRFCERVCTVKMHHCHTVRVFGSEVATVVVVIKCASKVYSTT